MTASFTVVCLIEQSANRFEQARTRRLKNDRR